MINFEVLGRVTAWRENRVAKLQPVQQLLLARLVVAGGREVSRAELERAVWDGAEPETGLKRVAHEVRFQLRALLPEDAPDPLPATAAGYVLPMDEDGADALRFAARLRAARDADAGETVPLLRAALREWGANPSGLYGGQPLAGLGGAWAEQTRSALRSAYRDARFRCVQADMREHRYEQLVWECDRLATDLDALHDEDFVELWMLAAYRAGLRTRALEIYKRSTESAAVHFDVPLRRSLHRLAELIRAEDPRLHGPDAPAALSAPAPAPSRGPSNVGKTMTEPPINQTARGKSRVTNMIGRVDGDVHIGAKPDPSENDDKPETEGRPERRDEA